MAMIDYGAWLIKDGILVNENQFFMDMKSAVGWEDSNEFPSDERIRGSVCGNYFAYAGDHQFSVAVYKTRILFMINGKAVLSAWGSVFSGESYNRYTENRVSLYPSFDIECDDGSHTNVRVHMKCITPGVWRASFNYKGSQYKLIYGYGIDPTMRVWNRTKVEYLRRKPARICERELRNTNVWHKIREV